jgi:type IV fimbrial biogenesis protein FimT
MKNITLSSVVARENSGKQIRQLGRIGHFGKKRGEGFTLIELMITLAVAGVFIALALPSFAQFLRNQRVSTQANEFVTALQTARSEAIKRRKQVDVVADASAGNANEWGGGWSVSYTDGGTQLVRSYPELEGNLTLNSAADLVTISYSGDGAVNTGADTVDLCAVNVPLGQKNRGRRISVSLTGRVSSSKIICP